MNWRRFSAVIVTLLATIATGIVTPSVASAADSGPWEIWPANNVFKCVEVAGASTTPSAQVQIWNCPASGAITPLHQRWIFRSTGDGYYRVVNGKSKLCMNIKGSTDVNSTKIVQYACGGSSTLNDQWSRRYVKSAGFADFYQFKSRLNPNKCLNIQGGGSANGADLIIYSCSDTADNNLFTWQPATQA